MSRSTLLKTRRRRGSYLGVTGKYPSLRNSHCLFAESFRERDLFALANFDSTVLRLDDHPLTIQYKDGNRLRSYTPDALLQRVDPTAPGEIIEVKMSDQLEKNAAELAPVFEAARAYAEANGKVFRILSEKELPRPLIRNLRFLFPYRRRASCTESETAILDALSEPKSVVRLCSDLLSKGMEQSQVIARAWRLVALQQVDTDLNQLLTPSAVLVRRPWTVTV
jgi:hypothetical protein